MPLNVALDMTKRLHHELAKHMTPEQRRDMTRIEKLIMEAQKQHKADQLRAQEAPAAAAPTAAAKKNARRRSFW